MDRFVCIHGHFYQPPRENPWLGEIERQPSAHPYHDWNERILAECYAPNANNYARISFNFGPTLLSWMERHALKIYRSILGADQQSCRLFSGHGSAMAQAYNHAILPLCNDRDRVTQVVWGIRDFESRFGRRPEGLWLPETAVDLKTLDVLAEQGILFTVLAPHQARCAQPEEPIDTTQPYRCKLPSGREIALFFYHGPLAHAISFERLLDHGEQFAERLKEIAVSGNSGPRLAHIATDGENYGHHHRFGEMALAFALDRLQNDGSVRLTNYGEYLAAHPPKQEMEIVEKSSWSCVHGVDRWWSDCGCSTGGHPGWNQAWRTPLRQALDMLRDALIPRYESMAARYFKDPWAARDASIELFLTAGHVEQFWQEQAIRTLSADEKLFARKLVELQRNALLMYTSCAWFFDDISRVEPLQILRYAGRVIQLARALFGEDLEPAFLAILEKAVSNIPQQGNGRRLYDKWVWDFSGRAERMNETTV